MVCNMAVHLHIIYLENVEDCGRLNKGCGWKKKGNMIVRWLVGVKWQLEILPLRLFFELATISGNRWSPNDYCFYRLWTLRVSLTHPVQFIFEIILYIHICHQIIFQYISVNAMARGPFRNFRHPLHGPNAISAAEAAWRCGRAAKKPAKFHVFSSQKKHDYIQECSIKQRW